VTLSDEEARRRGTQKTVLERRAPPTFDVLIEIQERQRLLVHRDVTDSVDRMLRGEPLALELRYRTETDKIQTEQQTMIMSSPAVTGRRGGRGLRDGSEPGRERGGRQIVNERGSRQNGRRQSQPYDQELKSEITAIAGGESQEKQLRVFAYGVARNRLHDVAKQLRVKIVMVDDLDNADVFVTLKSYYRKKRRLITNAEQQHIPIYVLRANSTNQMERFVAEVMDLKPERSDPFEEAIAEASKAINLVEAGQPSADLSPVGAAIRRYQHQMARNANLVSHSYGKEPRRHVRIFNTRRNQ
jgi:hypothetical protein